ncbi:hypothetical protein BDP27DRAFT_1380923 [Rhodocollybia butyracea]|uniref:Armadillo-like helical domain-containing protein n=1 Tax=Rhodocollybia butyracea TaxID=206335 RepID=A0A9P5Q585_9AGAR|nr:hypothetical protein BDP27DRAFT_1380923 [Rhodocollybia butyracea]
MKNSQLGAKFNTIYSKLLQGYTPMQISDTKDIDRFYSTLLDLDVNRDFLETQLNRLTKEECLGVLLKPTLNALFSTYISYAQNPEYHTSTRSTHALESLCILTKCILVKNLSGWEIIEVFAGSARESDTVFRSFTSLVDVHLRDETIPGNLQPSALLCAGNRHLALQLALIFLCGVGQLSPAAYFLRKDLYHSLIHYTFEAALLFAILANFHRSDASQLNPYLKRMKKMEDLDIMRKICWATSFALESTIRAYREIYNVEIASSTLISTFSSALTLLRPDRILSAKPELFKNLPIEACVSLLPIYEFLGANWRFRSILLEKSPSSNQSLLFTSLSLSSYLLTHATSATSSRALAYANLSLNWLLLISQEDEIMGALVQPSSAVIHLCRQKPPLLPPPSSNRLPICAILDCCVLWMKHNFHKRLEVHSYTNSIWICQQILALGWVGLVYNEKNSCTHVVIEYHWKEFWSAILGLFEFLATKLDSLYTTGGVENLVCEMIVLLDLCLVESSSFLPSPHALHEFYYELVHGYQVLQKQVVLLRTLAMPLSPGPKRWDEEPSGVLTSILESVRFYQEKISAAGARTASQAMQIVAREIDQNGPVHGQNIARRVTLP